MQDPKFAKTFEDFYLELTCLNYISKTGFKQFSIEDLKNLSYLKLLIPIYRRLQKEGTGEGNNNNLTLESILLEKDEDNDKEPDRLIEDAPGRLDQENKVMYYPSAPIISLLNREEEEEAEDLGEEDTSEDLEGDLQFANLTDTALILLAKIRPEKVVAEGEEGGGGDHWFIVEHVSEEQEVEVVSEAEEGDEGLARTVDQLIDDIKTECQTDLIAPLLMSS
ncbi:MAG: hypothetical protein Barrevirus9_3 [Barrevirus sp.]|uniref:Uncharacterized protein n=1 Tax=Barrevirus sp. TaxID=2487763 RepID=A0A3G4ZRS8_9VIRU|nr:MAG: hypothetical protein Barrevirus9_3 [Barrevirus sp.]